MAYTATLTVASGKVASDLSAFPVRVDLSHLPADWWTDTTSDLGNVRVKQAGTVVSFDVVAYDRTAKTGELFFKAPTLAAASSNVFTIETVDDATDLAATDPNGRDAVWADFEAVVLGGQLINRKGGAAVTVTGTATPTSDGMWEVPGGGTGYLSLGSLSRFTQWTTGASVILDTLTGDQHYISYGVLGTANTTVATQVYRNAAFRSWNSTTGFSGPASGIGTVGTRYRTHYTHDGSTARTLFYNGAVGVTGATAARPGGTGACGIYLGTGVQGSSNSLNGKVGYAYLRSGLLSADWIAAEYESWESPSTFYSVVGIPTAYSAAGTIAVTSGASGAVTATLQVSGTVAATSGTSGDVIKLGAGSVSGTVVATSGASGDVTVVPGEVEEPPPSGAGTAQDGYGWSWTIEMTADITAPLDPESEVVPMGVRSTSVPVPVLVDGRPV